MKKVYFWIMLTLVLASACEKEYSKPFHEDSQATDESTEKENQNTQHINVNMHVKFQAEDNAYVAEYKVLGPGSNYVSSVELGLPNDNQELSWFPLGSQTQDIALALVDSSITSLDQVIPGLGFVVDKTYEVAIRVTLENGSTSQGSHKFKIKPWLAGESFEFSIHPIYQYVGLSYALQKGTVQLPLEAFKAQNSIGKVDFGEKPAGSDTMYWAGLFQIPDSVVLDYSLIWNKIRYPKKISHQYN